MTEKVLHRSAIFLLSVDIFIQCFYIVYSGTGSETWFAVYVWINECGMYNFALLYCLLQAAFGDGLIWGIFGFLLIAISYLTALATLIFSKNHLYLLPMLIAVVDMAFVLHLIETPIFHYTGLLYKLFACMVYVLLFVRTKRNTAETD